MNTKRSRPLLLAVLAILLVGCRLPAFRPEPATLVVLHTNDLHSHLLPHADGTGGLARISGYVEQVRFERPDVLFLDAGDGVTGTPASTLFEGRPIFTVMSVMDYDAMALGNHEFDHGFPLIAEYRELATFPILSANARGPDGALLADDVWRSFDVEGTRIGVVGLLAPDTPLHVAAGRTEGCVFADPAETLRELLPELEREADLLVVLSHLGYEADRELALAVPEIDLIVGGHSHTEISEPVLVGETLIVQALAEGRRLGRLDLTLDRRRERIVSHEGGLLVVDDKLPVSERTAQAVLGWEERVREEVDEVIGAAARDLDKLALKARIEEVFQKRLGTDLGYQNPRGVRARLARGPIRLRDLFHILPFDNTLVTVTIRGDRLPAWARERLGAVEPARSYTVATNSYVSGHPEKYFPDGVLATRDSGIGMRDAVIEAVRERGGLR